MKNAVAIIPARGGSKGIPLKNLIKFCDKPLLAWSIEQALSSKKIDSVWVSSDNDEILKISENFGAKAILRPAEISTDTASSESAWLHGLNYLESLNIDVSEIIGLQATSPLRKADDIDNALSKFYENNLDSIFSVVEIEDFFMWRKNNLMKPESINYDYKKRLPRQRIERKYLENGSFYIFNASKFKNAKNRINGKIGMYTMEKFQMFQIDNPEDVSLCEIIMKSFIL